MKKLLLVFAVLFVALPVLAQMTETGSFSELTDVNRLIFPRDGITYQVSSYDRTGGNDDGFSGKYSFVRKEGENLVIFDQEGPGCIYRIWSANPEKGWVKFYFDGETEPRFSVDHFEDLFKGEQFPFVKPLVANYLGGWNSYVPIPFKKSCKIVVQGPMMFLQITWRKYASSEGVNTFTRDLSSQEKAAMDQAVKVWSNPGQPPMAFGDGIKETSVMKSTADRVIGLADIRGAGIIKGIKMKLTSPDQRAVRKVVFRVFTDGKGSPDVWSPVGDLFMSGIAAIETRSLLLGSKDGEMYCYFPMPFAEGARIDLLNETGKKLDVSFTLDYEPLESLPKDAMRFSAWWHRQNPTSFGQPFPILEAKGRGHWCGVNHFMHGDRSTGLGFLEGDEMLWVDGRDNSHYNGTGTEDYFCSGWYFGGQGCQPLYGCTLYDTRDNRIDAYRIHLTDLVPFKNEAKIVIEHGPGNDINADYAGVTYWYAEPGTTHKFAPVPLRERMMKPINVHGAVEAESSICAAAGSMRVTDDLDLPLSLSAGRGVTLSPIGSDAKLTLKANLGESAPYKVYALLVKEPSGGKVEAVIDGRSSGITVDTFAKEPKVEKVLIAQSDRLLAGEHEITLLSQGKRLLVDCLVFERGGIVEAEDLKVIDSNGPTEFQHMEGFGPQWGGGLQQFIHGGGPAFFTLELPIEKTGRYYLGAYLTKAGDYGTVQLKLDGKAVGSPVDCYNNGVVRSGRVELGTFDLSAGKHELTVEVTGKSEKSTGFYAGLDCLVVDRLK